MIYFVETIQKVTHFRFGKFQYQMLGHPFSLSHMAIDLLKLALDGGLEKGICWSLLSKAGIPQADRINH